MLYTDHFGKSSDEIMYTLSCTHYDRRQIALMSVRTYQLPEIDLNKISDETDLVPVVKSILNTHDSFLIRNYANKDILDELIDNLSCRDIPEIDTKFDANFTGVLELKDDIVFEQYIYNTDNDLPFNREMTNISMKRLYSRLFRIAMFFSKLATKSVVPDDVFLDESHYSCVMTRYFHTTTDSQLLPTGEVFEYATSPEYKEFLPTGLLTVLPIAKGVKFKPPTASSDDNLWITVEEEDCLLLHTGTLLSNLSRGRHTTSPLQISPDLNTIHLTLSLPLSTIIDNQGERLVDKLLCQQIQELPEAAAKLYPRDTALLNLKKSIDIYKEMFSVCETVLSLYSISRSSKTLPELFTLLQQVTNMVKRKFTEDDFLKMMYLWPECYIIEANSKCELTVRVLNNGSPGTFTTKSRLLQYVEKADNWYENVRKQINIPNDIPILKINKRRGSSGTYDRTKLENFKTKSQNLSNKHSYLSNSKEKYIYPEKKHDSQSNLLERLREKERRSAALLSQRQRRYERFLTVKMAQVFEILYSLPRGRPYTVTYLSTLIVDSLKDTNNPIGEKEAEEILDRLQDVLKNEIFVQAVEGGLKVYRWDVLEKNIFEEKVNVGKVAPS